MFTTGQKVVCINAEFDAWVFDLYQQLPKEGEVYTVRSVGIGAANPHWTPIPDDDSGGLYRGDTEPEMNILLAELANDNDSSCQFPQELSFRADRFAPLEETTKTEDNREIAYA